VIVIADRHEAIALWVGDKLGIRFAPPLQAIGFAADNGWLRGGAVFTGFNGCNIDITIAGHGCMTRSNLQTVYTYVFGQLGCERMTARVRRSNLPMRRLLETHPWLGFRQEGMQRRYWGPTEHDDVIVYGVLRSDFRFASTALAA
jgi:hypothetical protein